MDAILGEITLHQRRRKLDEMTKGESLGDAYAATVSRIKALQGGRSKLGMEVLMWVSHAKRPLHVDEMCHALGVEEESTDLNIRNIPAIETLLACSLGLVTVEKSSSTVRLVHYTLQEYLSNNPDLFLKPHSVIAGVCLTYLNFQHVRALSPSLRSVPPTASFVEYASGYWGEHAKKETSENVKTLAFKLFDGYDKHISSKILLLRGWPSWRLAFDREGTPRGFTGLHCAAYFGCVEITLALLKTNKGDVGATDFEGRTALAWAAKRGHEEVVSVLLGQSGVNPDNTNDWIARPLRLAAENGHEGVISILLERSDVNPDRGDILDRTPLWWAARNGHEGAVKILLKREDINPDKADNWGRTPLRMAVVNGHERVVRMLLQRNEVNPDKADKSSRTPLWLAAENGHEGVVRVLLERDDVNPDTVDIEYGRTPLLLAAGNGHGGIVMALLGRNDVTPDKPDSWSRTPLRLAAENGHEGVVRILLERGDVNPNTFDAIYGQTPLRCAAKKGHEGVVRMLRERSDANPDMADTEYGRPCGARGHR